MALVIEFLDGGRTAQNPANPLYPLGMDVDMSAGAKSCSASLPYPAPRCGLMLLSCPLCGLRVAVTVAGRADDPRSVRVACLARTG